MQIIIKFILIIIKFVKLILIKSRNNSSPELINDKSNYQQKVTTDKNKSNKQLYVNFPEEKINDDNDFHSRKVGQLSPTFS